MVKKKLKMLEICRIVDKDLTKNKKENFENIG